MNKEAQKSGFRNKLLQWNEKFNCRNMPWKGEKNPYYIWLSEIILQQTRVEQGMEYYNRFIEKYPSVRQLASANDTEVFKLWEGLGYYSRCRNLLVTARYISFENNGNFPDTYAGLLSLKGVGPYTAAAIASFAYNQPHAVVDGNVYRVLARFFGIETPVDSPSGKSMFTALANDLLDKKKPGVYNQAIMDFGASVCKPKLPLCDQCPMNKQCFAFRDNKVSVLPVNEKKKRTRTRFFNYILVEFNKRIFVRKRNDKDIWQNLHELVLHESNDDKLSENQLAALALGDEVPAYLVRHKPVVIKQQLTHQLIISRFIHISLEQPVSIPGYDLLGPKELSKLPFPKTINSYLQSREKLG